ncbi:hypothetical protein M2138_002127 [Dysgonomonadaceae bacterium PH5-43]|nr:hypothetical protein [Dysgonomonadaceae bacterium PH5-43]
MKIQKNMLLVAFIFSLMVSSCEEKAPEMIKGQWYGAIVRNSDGKEIGQSVLSFEEDKLKITSNALYSPSFNQLTFTEIKEGVYCFENDTSVLNLQITWNNDTLVANGADFNIVSVCDSLSVSSFIDNHKEREIPISADSYLIGYWEGELHRSSDDKLLSKISIEAKLDSMYVYSNAISGKDNIAWELVKYYDKSEMFEYQSSKLNWKLLRMNDEIAIEGDGCYATLSPTTNRDTSFFKNKTAHTNPQLYFAGNKYQGELVYLGDHALLHLFAKTYLEIDILDDSRARMKMSTRITNDDMAALSLFTGESTDTEQEEYGNYTISNNILHAFGSKFEIRDGGNILYSNEKIAKVTLKRGGVTPAKKERRLQRVVCEHCNGSGLQRKNHFGRSSTIGSCSYCQGKGKTTVYR